MEVMKVMQIKKKLKNEKSRAFLVKRICTKDIILVFKLQYVFVPGTMIERTEGNSSGIRTHNFLVPKSRLFRS